MDLLDPNLLPLKEPDEIEVLRVIKTALSCIQLNVARRPTMFTVVSMLVGDLEIPILTDKGQDYPSYLAIKVGEMSEGRCPSSSSLLHSKGGVNESPTIELAYPNSEWPNTRWFEWNHNGKVQSSCLSRCCHWWVYERAFNKSLVHQICKCDGYCWTYFCKNNLVGSWELWERGKCALRFLTRGV